MTVEFTGERVVPGQVDTDLWNEHFSRYVFAARLAHNRRVLDAGCGTGYGTAELARNADSVVGIDVSIYAVQHAVGSFARQNIAWLQASCTALPLASASFDLMVAFEVIEHLSEWEAFLIESRRVLGPSGQLVVSTPNRSFYAESRGESGPNPFHVHEFDYYEFKAALGRVFPQVSIFRQDHTEAIVFSRVEDGDNAAARIDPAADSVEHAAFYVAICGSTPPTVQPFVHVPKAGNIVKERTQHVHRLEGELGLKEEWLRASQLEHQNLLELHEQQKVALEQSNFWAQETETKLSAAGGRIVQLQEELKELRAGYEERLAECDAELLRRAEWAESIERDYAARLELQRVDLEKQIAELAKAVELLDQAEATVVERTRWAQQLERERDELAGKLGAVEGSRWLRLGRTIGVGPELGKG